MGNDGIFNYLVLSMTALLKYRLINQMYLNTKAY